MSATILILLMAALIPLPHRVHSPAVLQSRGAHRIYTSTEGRLLDALPEGTQVVAGDVVARLDDPELEREVAELTGRRDELLARLQGLEGRRLDDATAAGELAATRQAVESVTSQLETRQRRLDRLTLVAPADGTILPPPSRPAIRLPGELPDWSGNPLEPRNRGCHLEAGTLLCLIGDPSQVEASLYVHEDDVEALRKGQSVRVLLDQSAGHPLDGTIEAISSDPLQSVPAELAASQRLPVKIGDDGSPKPVETTYEVRVRLTEPVDGSTLRIRGIGRGKIDTGSRTLAHRLRRFLRRTFRFDL